MRWRQRATHPTWSLAERLLRKTTSQDCLAVMCNICGRPVLRLDEASNANAANAACCLPTIKTPPPPLPPKTRLFRLFRLLASLNYTRQTH